MKKYISILISAFILVLTSCDVIKDELGLNDEDKNQNNQNKEDDKKPQVNVNKNPCAYFTFDGNYDDLSGTDKYAYGNPEPTFVSGLTSGKKAIAFSRTNKTKVVINNGLLDSHSMTFSFWLKDVSEGDISYVTDAAGNIMMYLAYTKGHLKYVATKGNVRANYNSYGDFTHKAIDDGEWHHIVFVSDFNNLNDDRITVSLYVDGILMDTLTEKHFASWENNGSDQNFGTGTKFILGGDNT
ncbi:MAG: LamG domain-containing protein, partial [Bacilli bacterium]|nr:LamG domain-containing protein [Bacilli bacterium]